MLSITDQKLSFAALANDMVTLLDRFDHTHWCVTVARDKLRTFMSVYLLPSPFRIGAEYVLMNGETVKLVAVHNEGTNYESMEDEIGVNRYTTRDFGRVTGTSEYERNIDIGKIAMMGYVTPIWYNEMKAKKGASDA